MSKNKEEFLTALDDARAAMVRALNLSEEVFNKPENRRTFNDRGHLILINIDMAKDTVEAQKEVKT